MAYNGKRRGGGGKKQYDNTNRAAIYKNKDKENQKQGAPDYRGKINVEGKDYKISLWLAKIENGEHAGDTYMRGQIEEMEQKEGDGKGAQFQPTQAPKSAGSAPPPANLPAGKFDDDIPF